MKTIVITGTTSGIGKAFTELYSRRSDYKLILVSRNEEKLKSLITSKNLSYKVCDMMDDDSVKEVSEQIVNENATIDVLINNAGVGIPTDLETLSKQDYDLMMKTNVEGLIFFSKPFISKMKKQKNGQILNVSSPAGLQANPVAPVYCCSKFAIEAYTDGLREQLRDYGIKVSSLRPGTVDTGYWGKRDVPRDKFMTSEEVAKAIEFMIEFSEFANVKSIDLESVR